MLVGGAPKPYPLIKQLLLWLSTNIKNEHSRNPQPSLNQRGPSVNQQAPPPLCPALRTKVDVCTYTRKGAPGKSITARVSCLLCKATRQYGKETPKRGKAGRGPQWQGYLLFSNRRLAHELRSQRDTTSSYPAKLVFTEHISVTTLGLSGHSGYDLSYIYERFQVLEDRQGWGL